MWLSEPTTHTCKGKGYPHRCTYCHAQLQEGERYRRYVWRPSGARHLHVMVEHAHDRDCDLDHLQELEGDHAGEVAQIVRLAITEQVVVAVDSAGQSFTETVPVIEPVVESTVFANHSDEEIPF